MKESLRAIPKLEKERRDAVTALDQETARFAINQETDELRTGFADLPQILEHIEAVRNDVLRHVQLFLGRGTGRWSLPPPARQMRASNSRRALPESQVKGPCHNARGSGHPAGVDEIVAARPWLPARAPAHLAPGGGRANRRASGSGGQAQNTGPRPSFLNAGQDSANACCLTAQDPAHFVIADLREVSIVIADGDEMLLLFEADDVTNLLPQLRCNVGTSDGSCDYDPARPPSGGSPGGCAHSHARCNAIIDQYRDPAGNIHARSVAKVGSAAAFDLGQLAVPGALEFRVLDLENLNDGLVA